VKLTVLCSTSTIFSFLIAWSNLYTPGFVLIVLANPYD